ncbi:hypothetical protein HY641_02195 [Candidatus Woesearchaeota archaeon]|nr:hypothetical protein [Candidatus Woesearchaeota archaeon]
MSSPQNNAVFNEWTLLAFFLAAWAYANREAIYTATIQGVFALLLVLGSSYIIYSGFNMIRQMTQPKPIALKEPVASKTIPAEPKPTPPSPPADTSQLLVSPKPFQFKTEHKPDSLLQCRLHRADTLDSVQQYTLERAGYEKREFVPLGEIRRQSYYLYHEGGDCWEHAFVVQSIINKLQGRIRISKSNPSLESDIVFWHNGTEYALEVEAPLRTRQEGRLREMVKHNDARFGAWIEETLQSPANRPTYPQDNATQNR